MFDVDVCLVCGKHLHAGRAYCSEECQNVDTSPPVTASDSLYSAHFLPHNKAGDIPALAPTALGTALYKHSPARPRNRHSTSSSSASSTSWSTSTDDETDGNMFDCGYSSGGDCSDSIVDKPFLPPTRIPALLYTRRPSGTNKHSTIPMPMRGFSPPERRNGAVAHSAPGDSPTPSSTKCSGDSRRASDVDEDHSTKDSTVTTKSSKRSRNRASLPAYFSLLQMGNSPKSLTGPPLLPVLNRTPSTPKLVVTHGLPVTDNATSIHATPRGRRREAASDGSSSRRSENSRGRTRSRDAFLAKRSRARADIISPLSASRSSAEQRRGRATERTSTSPSRIENEGPRGRVPASLLDGVGSHMEWPGYGNGRSGLMHRGHTDAFPAFR